MNIGISTLGFRELTNAQLAKELAVAGFKTIQLCLAQSDSRFWKDNDRSDLSTLNPERCREIADTYRSAGLAIHSLGIYTNLIHPDEVERLVNLAYFEPMLETGDHMGVRTFITEAGHYQHLTESEARPTPFSGAGLAADDRHRRGCSRRWRRSFTRRFSWSRFTAASSPAPNARGCFWRRSTLTSSARCSMPPI